MTPLAITSAVFFCAVFGAVGLWSIWRPAAPKRDEFAEFLRNG